MSRTLLKNDITLCREDGSSVKFHITSHIGSGASCVVYHAVCEDKTEHLLKEYYPQSLDLERNFEGKLIIPEDKKDSFEAGLIRFRCGNERQKEVRLSEQLKNFTSNVQGYFYGNHTEYIDMAVFSGRTYSKVESESLYDLLRRMKVLAQVVGNYHHHGLLHLDIKPDNIFVRPEEETVEDLILFDFDSVVEKSVVMTTPTLSYTKEWGAPEQLLAYKRENICEATDLYAIGEIVFTKIFGRHSTSADRRSFAKYEFDHNAEIFKNVNPKVFPLLKTLLSHTICGVIQKRYQTADELIAVLDELVVLANPKEPYLKTNLPAVSGFFTGRDDEIQEIHEKLSKNNLLFIRAIGGMGKSELAKHFANQYKDEYDTIIFAPFVNDAQMMIIDDDNLPIYNLSQYSDEKADEYFARKMRKLRELCDERTLIIVDNLDTTEDRDIDKLFKLGCKILVTTRMDFSDVYTQIDLGVLKNPMEVFSEYYKKTLSDAEKQVIQEIIEFVGKHTMTVELLAKQMMIGHMEPQEMLEKLKNGDIGESGEERIRIGKDGNISEKNTYDHIQALFDLSELSDEDQYVLGNLSLIPHTGIQIKPFCEICEKGNMDTVNALIVQGWIRWEKATDSISLHPVIGEIVKSQLKVEDSVQAKYFLGKCHYYGYGIKKNYSLAYDYFNEVLEQGYLKAHYDIGPWYENGYGIKKDFHKAIGEYKKYWEYIDKDDADVFYHIAESYYGLVKKRLFNILSAMLKILKKDPKQEKSDEFSQCAENEYSKAASAIERIPNWLFEIIVDFFKIFGLRGALFAGVIWMSGRVTPIIATIVKLMSYPDGNVKLMREYYEKAAACGHTEANYKLEETEIMNSKYIKKKEKFAEKEANEKTNSLD